MAVIGTEAQILEALLWFFTEIGTSPTMRIAQPAVAFTPTLGTPYLAATVLPNTAELFGTEFDGDVDFQGLAQISVFWPSGQGLIKPQQVASQIVAACAPGTRIDRNGIRVRFDQRPSVAPALVEADWVQIPVNIRWRAFVSTSA